LDINNMTKVLPPKVTVANMRGNAGGVTMVPQGVAKAAPKKPSSALPPVIKAQAKPMTKGSGTAPKAKVKDPIATVTPYGLSHPKFSN
jgi:hypothetical protein